MHTTIKAALLALSLMFAACDQEPISTEQGAVSFWCDGWTVAKACTAACGDCVKQYSCTSLSITAGNTGECIAACSDCH